MTGVGGDGPVVGLDDPEVGPLIVQLAGEMADEEAKARIWQAADAHFEPTWDRDTGEFTLGFGLDEPHPRGQLNARALAGWVCTEGAWSRVFDQPNLAKFDQPTVVDVDFPTVALSQARWDGDALHLAAHPRNAAARDSRTRVRVTNLGPPGEWAITSPDGVTHPLERTGDDLTIELVADDEPVRVHPAR